MTFVYGAAAAAAFAMILLYVTDYKLVKIFANRYVLIAALGLAARLLAARIDAGFQTDIDCFKGWAEMLYANGFGAFYSSDVYTDYPPGYMYALYALGAIRSVFGVGGDAYTLLIKLPAMLADIAAAMFIYRLAEKRLSGAAAFGAALLYVLNPAVILDSSVWGQVDSVHTFLIIVSLYALTERKFYAGFALFAFAALVKPQSLMFSPIYIHAAFNEISARSRNNKAGATDATGAAGATDATGATGAAGFTLRLAAVCLAVVFIGCLPFAAGFDFMPVIKQFGYTLASYPYATVNAYNLYALMGLNWFPADLANGLFLNVTGLAVLLCIVAFSFYLLKRDSSAGGVFKAAAFICVTVFVFSIKMHERYVFPALALLVIAYVYTEDARLPLLYAGFSITLFINCADVLNVYGNGRDYTLMNESLPVVSAANVMLALFMLKTAGSDKNGASSPEAASGPEASSSPEAAAPPDPPAARRAQITKTDFILLGSLTLVYSAAAFFNLGNARSPQTFWRADAFAEVTADFAELSEIKKFMYMVGARTDNKFELLYSLDGAYWESAGEMNADGVFSWTAVDTDFTARHVKLVSMSDGLMLMEAAFKDGSGNVVAAAASGNGAELFDESELVPDAPNYMNSTYFDEIYHPRTAYEFVHGLEVYETTHPPLGKVLIAVGVRLFGMTPFGWRFIGTLFGCLMVPLMYVFARRIFGEPRWAFFASLVFAFDFMHFAQTRLATIDTYVTFFVLAMYYFMYRYVTADADRAVLNKKLLWLFLSGVSLGLAAASKWQGLYAAVGLAFIFFHSLYVRYKERRAGFARETAITLPACVIFFIAVPLAIYLLSYIPYLSTEGADGLKAILANQSYMYNYHSKWVLDSTHPYSSRWWSWPFMLRPIFYYGNTLPNGMKQGISSFGNPAVWWVGIVAFFYSAGAMYKRTDDRNTVMFLLVAFAAQYVPWMTVDRTTYIYHFFPSVPFIVLMIAYMFKDRLAKKNNRAAVAYCAVVVALFILFYPVISGYPVSAKTVAALLRWLPSWALVR